MNYAQNKEQEVILNYFDKLNRGVTPPDYIVNGAGPTFLDLGANDGITFSNTRALAERGFKGVLVEPSPKAFALLEKNYEGLKGFYLYPYAISGHNGNIILHESGSLINKNDVALVSTVNAFEMKRFENVTSYTPTMVKCFKWKTFLNRLTIKEFDFISADCEGSEMDFLPDMDLTNTKLICLEHNGKAELKKQYLECTSKYGLSNIIYESGENIIISR